MKYKKLMLAIFMVIGLLTLQVCGYCQEQSGQGPAKEEAAVSTQATIPTQADVSTAPSNTKIKGNVSSIDMEKSILVVEYLKDPITNTYEKMEIVITPDTKLMEKDVTIMLEDLDTGDDVIVEGVLDNSEKMQVESISLVTE